MVLNVRMDAWSNIYIKIIIFLFSICLMVTDILVILFVRQSSLIILVSIIALCIRFSLASPKLAKLLDNKWENITPQAIFIHPTGKTRKWNPGLESSSVTQSRQIIYCLLSRSPMGHEILIQEFAGHECLCVVTMFFYSTQYMINCFYVCCDKTEEQIKSG